ncbi:hypothetical protein F3Y22_tig00111402pilonHSYRG00913 [Hibiscus syriacus]|uniref:DUF4283 domain-containing protein n=1 Tax=Hibiscus syriacus TaxID=106335 RepID=A0A6A2Y9Y5_HIBSY|nr:hypothetical protein F3Y22_tig00111402pilonHSYRG00913 [Hibiscus syriacus]
MENPNGSYHRKPTKDFQTGSGRPPDIPSQEVETNLIREKERALKDLFTGGKDGDVPMQDNIIELHHETNKIDDPISTIHQIEGRKSYAAMVIGSSMSRVQSCPMLEEDEIALNEGDYIIDNNEEYPTIRFSERIYNLIDKNMLKSVIVRLIGRAVGFKALESRIQTLWQPQGRFQLVDLENNYFIIRFGYDEDYVKTTGAAFQILQKIIIQHDYLNDMKGYEGRLPYDLYGHTEEHCPSFDYPMGPAKKEGMSTPENHQHNQLEQILENNQ